MATIPQDKLEYIKTLYYRDKISAAGIASKIGVPLDAVFYFMRKNGLKRRSASENNAVVFERKATSFKPRIKLTQKDRELKTAGVMLYWAEGFKSKNAHHIDFANSDPNMIMYFLIFLRRICGVDESRLRVYLYCYSNQDAEELIKFWSRLTSIPKKQFTKPYVREDFDIRKIDKMKHGLIHIRYHDKKLLELIRNWINDSIKEYAQIVP